MKVALCLQSCERHAETVKTLESFHRFNGFQLQAPFPVFRIHAEDGKLDERNEEAARKYGFVTVSSAARRGNTGTRKHLIKCAEKRGATHVLFLENDWESDREVPWDLIQFVFTHPDHDIYHLRLWHHFKHRSTFDAWDKKTPLVARGHAGRDRADPGWKPLAGGPEPVDVGDHHWGAPPSVTRIQELLWLHADAGNEADSIRRSGLITARTAQVKTNVFWHIGDERTPGFMR
jgi:hypothetical protein